MPNITIPESPYGQGENIRLAAEITKAGSKQTYYTFLLLADRDRVQDAFRSYAYFRWLDDLLDCEEGSKQEKSSRGQSKPVTSLHACRERWSLGINKALVRDPAKAGT